MAIILKLCGSLCILGAASYYGILLNKTFDDRNVALRHLYSIFLQLKSEMQYMNTPLPECFASIGEHAKEPIKSWLLGIASSMENQEETSFGNIWRESLETLYMDSALKKEDINLLLELADKLGAADRNAQMNAMDYTLIQLERNRTGLEQEMKEKKKVITTITMFVGLVTLIVLL